ncbi:alpha/beta fold hydrolase [Nocardia bovistercoris]|uniref:Alpha/beta hydrolase n=1 Tax=Nocardia bovistercoris TaxID=2785916 RepID=A0A931N4R0_9NOCA|nr:alpha/beta hydrolase [Nocardia bovistercoris]MBH0777878.1 alpha/beta hydrolase [Nocardia bovistercoris]
MTDTHLPDEFALLPENADDAGLDWHGPPPVRRVAVDTGAGLAVSGLRWGDGEPELVLLHGGAQNAHTWDTVALALDRPLLALDLPGHGHSDWWPDHLYTPPRMAAAVATAIDALAPRASAVVGMSLGGFTALSLATLRPDLVRRLILVDVTPGVGSHPGKTAAIVAFVGGPADFAGFDDILEHTVTHNPTRSVRSLRRGVLHNARPRPDGRWVWRYDRIRPTADGSLDLTPHWDDVTALRVPLLLVRGGRSPVVDDADSAELLRRLPGARVETVEGAGHSVQGDRPLELAELIRDFTRDPAPSAPH